MMIHRSALARLMDLTMVPLLEDRLRELTSTCPFFRANESVAFILTLSNTRHYRENDRGGPLISDCLLTFPFCLPLTGGLISAGRQFIPSGSIRNTSVLVCLERRRGEGSSTLRRNRNAFRNFNFLLFEVER